MNNLNATSHHDPNVLFEELLVKASYLKEDPQFFVIQSAYEFAASCHSHQIRKSGEPYIIHPLCVASILTDLKLDIPSLGAALLHDVVEDTQTPLAAIEERFGKVIADLVDGLTKIGKITFQSNQERMAENFRKMLLAMAKDLRVILVKLADRLHNMRTLDALVEGKRHRIAKETMDVYAPLAHRLGLYGMKSELEDLCLKIMKHDIYKEISKNIVSKKREREVFVQEIKGVLEEELKAYGFGHVVVYGRPKHFFSIYKKMLDRRIAFEDIHDLFAFRILVDSVKDCYEALGVVHALWKPMPGRFKDYIAMPKENFYQSLHTTVMRPNGTIAEIQIRTFDMHNICEYGIAAHWVYKEKSPANKEQNLKKFTWLRQMLEIQHDVKDPHEFLASIKVDWFEEEIFVFTPKGDVLQLNQGATALDFAFSVHTNIGLKTSGTKVNGKLCPLKVKLKSGDIVEVLTASYQKPTKDWLGFVTTTKAKSKIRSYLRSEQRESSKAIGAELLRGGLQKIGMELEKLPSQKIELLYRAGKESSYEELLIALGYGRLHAKDVIERAFPQAVEAKTLAGTSKEGQGTLPSHGIMTTSSGVSSGHGSSAKVGSNPGILVSGMSHLLVSLGRCCHPLPGEDILGFVTRGKGVSIHRNGCPRALDLDPARRVPASWADGAVERGVHVAYIRVLTQDRAGILAEVTSAISAIGANIQRAQVRVKDDLTGVFDFELQLKNLHQLNQLIKRIEGVREVILVERNHVGFYSKA